MVTAPEDEPRLMTQNSKLSPTLARPPKNPASVSVPSGSVAATAEALVTVMMRVSSSAMVAVKSAVLAVGVG
jgi:hypothetical protein